MIAILESGHQGVHSVVCTAQCEIAISVPVQVILKNKLKFLTTPNASVGTMEAAVIINMNKINLEPQLYT